MERSTWQKQFLSIDTLNPYGISKARSNKNLVQPYFENSRKIKSRVTFSFDFQEKVHYALMLCD